VCECNYLVIINHEKSANMMTVGSKPMYFFSSDSLGTNILSTALMHIKKPNPASGILRKKYKYLAMIAIGMNIDKQYERIDAAGKTPIDELNAAMLNAETNVVKANISIVLINIAVVDFPLSIAAMTVDKRMHIIEGPRNSKSSSASPGETLFV
jgi:hypothetical protein